MSATVYADLCLNALPCNNVRLKTQLPSVKFLKSATIYACIVSRQEKAKQLVGLQSELKLLEADIKQVAGRKAIAAPLDTNHSQQAQPSGSAATAIAVNGAIPPQAASLAPANGLLTAVAALPGFEATQPSGSAAGNLTSPLATQLPHATVAAQQASGSIQQHAAAASCVLEGSMSRTSNGYLMITNPHTAQPVLCSAAPAGVTHIPATTSGTAGPAAAPGLPVAPPTQLGANGSMHIHPRHLAFQHFQQQQAALQQRQQQPGGGQGLASAPSLDSTDGDAMDRMDRAASLASAQSDAIRCAFCAVLKLYALHKASCVLDCLRDITFAVCQEQLYASVSMLGSSIVLVSF